VSGAVDCIYKTFGSMKGEVIAGWEKKNGIIRRFTIYMVHQILLG
jgi:hypothetical protein